MARASLDLPRTGSRPDFLRWNSELCSVEMLRLSGTQKGGDFVDESLVGGRKRAPSPAACRLPRTGCGRKLQHVLQSANRYCGIGPNSPYPCGDELGVKASDVEPTRLHLVN